MCCHPSIKKQPKNNRGVKTKYNSRCIKCKPSSHTNQNLTMALFACTMELRLAIVASSKTLAKTTS